ncbi:MAG: LysM peptidoglycan-binding domain-containing M23 family metallopeptidase [Candidatus Brocadiia bacterium]
MERTSAGVTPGIHRLRPCLGVILALLFCAGSTGCTPGASARTEPGPEPETPGLNITRPRSLPLVYHVRPNDTLSSLGRRFNVPWQEIAEENEIVDPTQLRVGQVLFIPRLPGMRIPEEPSPQTPAGPPERRAVPRSALHRGSPSARFWWPTDGSVVRRYGDPLRGLPDPGIAIAAPAGTEVYAATSGTVVTCVRGGSAWGNVVAVAHSEDWVSWYAHLGRVLVGEGDRVGQGDVLGTVGATGAVARPRLAFRLFRNERPVDPEQHLP